MSAWDSKFTVKPEHGLLLGRMIVRWEDGEFGAPAIDSKRPYGNSDVIEDMCEILGIEYDEDEGVSASTEAELTALHRETVTALQILLSTGSLEDREYESHDYGTTWA